MAYVGKKPTDKPLASADLGTGIVTSAKILDGTIANADVNDVAASKLTGALPAISGASLTALNATNLGSGTVPTARLGTGSASSSVFLAGDNTWIAAGGGKIGQVVQTLKTDTENTTSTTFVSANFAVAITPVATSSKVLLFVNFGSIIPIYGGQYVHTKIDGGNCATYIGAAALGYETAMSLRGATDSYDQNSASMMYLDSPSTTSATTYTVHWASSGTSVWLNQAQTLRATSGNTASTFIAMEILA